MDWLALARDESNVPRHRDLCLYTRSGRSGTLNPMTPAPRDRLQKVRAEIVDDIARDEAQLAVGAEDRGEDSTPSQHPADVASDLFARESVLTIDRRLRSQLAGIDDALRQVRDGRYGICEDCGRPIPQERLEALPQAVRCIECQRREEHRLGS